MGAHKPDHRTPRESGIIQFGRLLRQAGHTQQVAAPGAVTLIQRFGSALNLNIHFHMLFLDGLYVVTPRHGSRPRFQRLREPTSAQLTQLAHAIAHRVGRLLEREGLLERDTEQLDLGKAGQGGVWFGSRRGIRSCNVQTAGQRTIHDAIPRPPSDATRRPLHGVFDLDWPDDSVCNERVARRSSGLHRQGEEYVENVRIPPHRAGIGNADTRTPASPKLLRKSKVARKEVPDCRKSGIPA